MYMSVDMKTQADRDGREEAFDEGKAEGMAEGKAEGKAEGILEGKKEIARQLVLQGVPIDAISKATGLSTSEIKCLK